jgi:hypothetical protein
VFSVFFLIAACGTEPSAPKISTLRLSPEGGVRPAEVLTATIDYVDEDGDLSGGTAEIGLRRQEEPEGDLIKTGLGGSGGSTTRGTIMLTVRMPAGAIPGSYDFAVTIVDSAMRRSNPLVTAFEVLR